MTAITDLINCLDFNAKEYENFLQDLIYSNGDVPFEAEEVDKTQSTIVSVVNNLLNQSNTRYKGLLILDKILSRCSKDVFSKYCMLWISKASQVLESIHSTPHELTMSCKVLGYLIKQSKEIPEIQKQVSMQNVKQLITAIGNLSSDKKCGPVYYLLAVLLHLYPEVCERFQVSLKKIILLQIDAPEETLVKGSAKCYVLLSKATERSFKPPVSKAYYTSWTYNQALICNSLHSIMDELFSGLVELETINIWDKLELPNISEKNIMQFYFNQKQRFVNLCSYLSCMLCGFEKKNSVLPHEILKVLCRGLAIQPSNLRRQNSIKEQMLYLILPKLHIALLNVLDALINGFKEQLIPFGSTILQLFLQTLQWTEIVLVNQVTISGNKPFKTVRVCIYKCLTSWLVNTNTLSGIETVSDECLPSILKDIVPERDRVLLTIQKTQNLSKRALKRHRNSQYEKSTYLNNGTNITKEYSLDVDTCKQALISLQNIFLNSGNLLKQTFFKSIQNIVVPLLYDCYLSSTEDKFYKENSECRLLLLKVLRALQMNPHPLVPLPTQYSIEIFEMALIDTNLPITQEARIALAELEKLIHPQVPSMQLIQVETIQHELTNTDLDKLHDMEHSNDLENVSVTNDENTIDEVLPPSSNKKLKTTNSCAEASAEATVQNISNVQEKNEKSLEVEKTKSTVSNKNMDNNPTEKTNIISDKSTLLNENPIQTSVSILHDVISAPNVNDIATSEVEEMEETTTSSPIPTSSSLLPQLVKENENIHDETTNSTEDNNANLENASKTIQGDVSNNEQEEEEILQLFQDVPKN